MRSVLISVVTSPYRLFVFLLETRDGIALRSRKPIGLMPLLAIALLYIPIIVLWLPLWLGVRVFSIPISICYWIKWRFDPRLRYTKSPPTIWNP